MKKLFLAATLLLALFSCDNGGYTTIPGNDNTTPNNNDNTVSCPTGGVTDSVCSCTDSMSCYLNGQLLTYDHVIALAPSPLPNDTPVLIYGGPNSNNILLSIEKYEGVGTYDIVVQATPQNVITKAEPDWFFRSSNADEHHCGGGKIVVTYDDKVYIKGTFYTILWRDDQVPYYTVKGGRFIAKWN